MNLLPEPAGENRQAMMKQTIKKVLQERQRKEYRKELASQLRDYDSWIRGQETPLLVSEYVAEKSEKSFSVSDYTGESFPKCLIQNLL